MKSRQKAQKKDLLAEIIREKPSWIIRNGLLVFMVFIMLFIASLNFIPYRTTISANINLIGSHEDDNSKVYWKGSVPLRERFKIYPKEAIQMSIKGSDSVNAIFTGMIDSLQPEGKSGDTVKIWGSFRRVTKPYSIQTMGTNPVICKLFITRTFFQLVFERFKSGILPR